jgi:hypothetical protein
MIQFDTTPKGKSLIGFAEPNLELGLHGNRGNGPPDKTLLAAGDGARAA